MENNNTITQISESISLYAKSLVDHKLIVKQTVERTEKVYIVDNSGKEHFSHRTNVVRKTEEVEFPV